MNISLSPMDYYFFLCNLYAIQFIFEYSGYLDIGLLSENLHKTVSVCDAISSRLRILSRTEIIFETDFQIPVSSRHISNEPGSSF